MRWLDGITDSVNMLLLLLSCFSRDRLCDSMDCSNQASLFLTRLVPIELVMPSSHLILC